MVYEFKKRDNLVFLLTSSKKYNTIFFVYP